MLQHSHSVLLLVSLHLLVSQMVPEDLSTLELILLELPLFLKVLAAPVAREDLADLPPVAVDLLDLRDKMRSAPNTRVSQATLALISPSQPAHQSRLETLLANFHPAVTSNPESFHRELALVVLNQLVRSPLVLSQAA